MSKENKKPFTDLVNNLKDGTLGHNHIQMAYRAWIRERAAIPDGIKDILSGRGENESGLLYPLFQVISELTGGVELAWHRGYQAGWEESREAVNP